jgi:polyhydroxybutyrate depolymerase
MRLLIVACLIVVAAAAGAGCRDGRQGAPGNGGRPEVAGLPAGEHVVRLRHNGPERSYILYVPPGDPVVPRALVLVFHGGGGTARSAARQTGFNRVAAREGFLVVYPEGTGRFARLHTFNAGNCCGSALHEDIDDVGFARRVVEDVAARVSVDDHAVFVTGMSNGGMMAYRLACEAADLFAAAGPVAGALNVEKCTPSQPISIVAFHGTADRSVRYEGGRPIRQADRTPRVDTSVAASIGAFVAANGCVGGPAESRYDPSVQVTVYGPCKAGSEVRLYTIEGGGHSWPGGTRLTRFLNEPYAGLPATELLWEFFDTHRR